MKLTQEQTLMVGGAAVAVILLWLASRNAAGVGKAIGGGAVDLVTGVISGANNALPEAIRPTSDQNIFYKAINLPGRVITGDQSWNLGGWIYDVTHQGQ